MTRRSTTIGLVSLVLGLGAGVAVAGCGEDRGSVDVEGGTTGGTVATGTTESTTPETTGSTTPETTGTTETDTTGSGY